MKPKVQNTIIFENRRLEQDTKSKQYSIASEGRTITHSKHACRPTAGSFLTSACKETKSCAHSSGRVVTVSRSLVQSGRSATNVRLAACLAISSWSSSDDCSMMPRTAPYRLQNLKYCKIKHSLVRIGSSQHNNPKPLRVHIGSCTTTAQPQIHVLNPCKAFPCSHQILSQRNNRYTYAILNTC